MTPLRKYGNSQEAWMRVPEGATKRWEVMYNRFRDKGALEFTIVEIQ